MRKLFPISPAAFQSHTAVTLSPITCGLAGAPYLLVAPVVVVFLLLLVLAGFLVGRFLRLHVPCARGRQVKMLRPRMTETYKHIMVLTLLLYAHEHD